MDLNFSGRRRLPMIFAAEAAECGLACLAMVARFHGHDVDLNSLRRRYAVSLAGASLRQLMNIADSLGFSSRPAKVELDELSRLRMPAILHWDLNHFVVLKAVTRRSAIIHDPARGVQTVSINELSQRYSGVVFELWPAADFAPVVSRTPMRLSLLWSKLSGVGSVLTQIIGLSISLQVVAFALPFQFQLAIDEGVGRSDANLLDVLALAFAGLILLHGCIEILRGWVVQAAGHMMTYQMIGNILRHMLRLPIDYFEKRQVGDILSRLGAVTSIQEVVTKGLATALIDGVMALVSGAVLWFYSPLMAMIVYAIVGLNLAVAAFAFPIMQARRHEEIVKRAREQSHLLETLRSMTPLRLMGREREREAAWRGLYSSATNAAIGVGRWQLGLNFCQTLLSGLETVLIIYIGARLTIAGDGFSTGMLVAFLSFSRTFTERSVNLINQMIQFRFLSLHLDRIGDIVSTEPEPQGEGTLRSVEGGIVLRDVAFRYASGMPMVLKGVTLEIAPGSFTAIVGPSGGGKTTLLKLMLGLRHPTSGSIELDGQPVNASTWRSWRQHVSVVSQDDALLSGTIADNISGFETNATVADVIAAATSARIHDEISRMPMGYESLIGDMGSALSGGQRQRVLLARALYRRPKILFLDEGTANLDETSEQAIADFIQALPITRIVVAHRPALIERADQVLRLENGEIHVRPSLSKAPVPAP